ncbi:MAG TPA: NAD(+)/NADH kinase, partial [Gaiellaceae bacterium]
MTSTSESTKRSPQVKTAAVVTHGHVAVESAVERVRAVAAKAGVTLVDDPHEVDLVVVLGGDGTMLRTLARLLGTDVPVIGVNYGRVGFLASIRPDDLDRDLARVFAGEYVIVELPTIEVRLDGERHVAV